jgi:hypothetical protein
MAQRKRGDNEDGAPGYNGLPYSGRNPYDTSRTFAAFLQLVGVAWIYELDADIHQIQHQPEYFPSSYVYKYNINRQ